MLVVGLSLFIFSWSFGDGFHEEMINNAVETHMAHIQIHKKGFVDNPILKNRIADPMPIIEAVKKTPKVISYAPRVKCQGLASTAYASSNVSIVGIDPTLESKLTNIQDKLLSGRYINVKAKDEAMIGIKLAEKLELDLGDKIIVTGQSLKGDLKAEAFKVVGIYRTSDPSLDKYFVYIPISTAQKFFAMGTSINEVAIDVKKDRDIKSALIFLKKNINNPDLEILSWREVNPALVQFIQLDDISLYITVFIVAVVIALEVYNTLLMSILERTKEFGVMLAMGTKPSGIVAVVVFEAIFMGAVTILFGCTIGGLSSLYFVYNPLDFSFVAEGFEAFAVSPLINFSLGPKHFIVTSAIMFLIVIISSLYPAIKASRLKPVEAIRFL